MTGPHEPIFLGRETYRRRRLIDGLRLLPLLGLLLFLAPLLGSDGPARSTALSAVYIFAAWFALILLSALLVRLLGRAPAEPTEAGGEESPGAEPPA